MTGRPEVRLAKSALQSMERQAKTSAKERLEVGGYLLGHVNADTIVIHHATGPGPNAVRTPVMFRPDPLHGERERRRLSGDRPLCFVGEHHLHGVDGLSGGDRHSLRAADKRVPGYLSLVLCGYETRTPRLFGVVGGKIEELRFTVFNDERRGINLSRISRLLDTTAISGRWVLIHGLGTGGSALAVMLSRTGSDRLITADCECVEDVNLPRHIAMDHQIGRLKTDVVKSAIMQINPDAVVVTINEKLTAETLDDLRSHVRRSRVVYACSGSPVANRLLNQLCREERKPAVFAGSFAGGKGGFALASDPALKSAPCFNCINGFARSAQDDTNEAFHHQTGAYGVDPHELSAQQALYADILPIVLLQYRLGMHLMLRRTRHRLEKPPGNFALWDSRTMSTRWLTLKKRDGCAVCGADEWLAAHGGHESGDTRKPISSNPPLPAV